MAGNVVIGIGNPLVSDDAVGIEVARRLKRQLPPASGVEVRELYSGGLWLMEAMAGFDRAILVDAITTGGRPGTVYALEIDDLAEARNTSTLHDGSLYDALEFGRHVGLKVPSVVRLLAVEAQDVSTFHEGLSVEVEEAVATVLETIERELSDSGHKGDE